MKYYGAKICKDCVKAAAAIEEQGLDIEFIDITANTDNLRAFLKLRDTAPEFESIREDGKIGIPCFITDDGAILFDVPGITEDVGGCASCG